VLAPGATPAELLAALDPPPWVHRGPLLILVNRHPADISTPLKDGDQVIFMLPAGGG
jgi:molybdopterin converting factor small subunit